MNSSPQVSMSAVLRLEPLEARDTPAAFTVGAGGDFATLAAAVTATNAAAGADTLMLLDAVTPVSSQLVVTDTLTLRGQGRAASTVLADTDIGVDFGNTFGLVNVRNGAAFNVGDLTFDGSNGAFDVSELIAYDYVNGGGTPPAAGGTIDNVAFQNVVYAGSGNPLSDQLYGTGVIVSAGDVTVQNSSFFNLQRGGAWFFEIDPIFNSGVFTTTTGTFRTNTYVGRDAANPTVTEVAVEVSDGAAALVSGNTFTDVGSATNGTSAAVFVHDTNAGGANANPTRANLVLVGNAIQSGGIGVQIGLPNTNDRSTFVQPGGTADDGIQYNNIVGNATAGVLSGDNDGASPTPTPVNAVNNFWGSNAGPGAGVNNGVVYTNAANNIHTTPFLTAATPVLFAATVPDYLVQLAPTVTGLGPTSGPLAGGTSVVISGTGFTGATSVSFGATPASFIVTSDTSITATAPAGTGTVDVTVTTASGTSAGSPADQFTYTGQAPAVTSAGAATFTAGAAGSFTVTTTGMPVPTLSVPSPGLPAGVSFTDTGDGTATLSGAPAAGAGGTYSFTVTAANGVSPDATQSFTLTVNQAPAVTSAAGTTLTAGAAGSFTVTATGFPAPTFSVTGGVLPPGVTLSPGGVLGGTPTATGTFAVTLTADNGVSPAATQVFTLTVAPAPVSPPSPVRLSAVGTPNGGGPRVTVRDADGAVRFDFLAYAPGLRGGVHVAVADLNRDGVDDVVTGAGAGGAPHVKVFDGKTGAEVASFFAYAPGFRGGVDVGAADGDGDGVPDIVTGAGAGGSPHVKAFRFDGLAEVASFFAFEASFRGGVTVASGNLIGDAQPELVLGAGAGGGPVVTVFDGVTGDRRSQFLAGPPSDRGGVRVALTDLDGNGSNELVARAGGATGVYDPLTGADLSSGFTAARIGGVFVG